MPTRWSTAAATSAAAPTRGNGGVGKGGGAFAKGKNKPFALTEWGLWGEDQPKYVKKVFRFMKQRDYADMLIYYQDFGSSNEFRIQNFPRSKKALKKKIDSDRFPKFAKKYPRFR